MTHRTILSSLLVAILAFAAGAKWARSTTAAPLASRIFRQTEARAAGGDWGSIRIYTEDGTPTFGTSSMLTAELEFLPGKQLQPPHQHAEEEFQYIISGTGTWFLNGEEIPIQPGDLMYTKPWDRHGIRNSSGEPLRFFVVKWTSGGIAPPSAPAP